MFINIQISTCFSEIAPCKGSSYFPVPKKLNNLMKKLVNIKNEDEECFRWCLDKNSAIIRNIDIEYSKQLNFQGIKFAVQEKKIMQKLKNSK